MQLLLVTVVACRADFVVVAALPIVADIHFRVSGFVVVVADLADVTVVADRADAVGAAPLAGVNCCWLG